MSDVARVLYPGRERELAPDLLANLLERILHRIEHDTNGGCWLWPGSERHTYGTIKPPLHSPLLVHRLTYTALVGEIPPGQLVLHRCDVRPCCRPSHLFLGSHAINSQDAAAKKRFYLQRHPESYEGCRNPNAKLAPGEVAELRRLAEGGVPPIALASLFGIHRSHVSRLINLKQYLDDRI